MGQGHRWLGVGCAIWVCAASAHTGVWRCGNQYVDASARARHADCRLLTLPPLGQVPATTVLSPPTSTPPSERVPSATVGVPELEVLQQALVQAQERMQALEHEWNGGQPPRSALELRNPHVWNQRKESLQAQRAAQAAQLQRLEQAIERRTRGPE